jgi:hypothetical protein
LVAIGLWFAAALPILAADTGADVPRPPPPPTQALIPQPSPRFAGRGDQINLKEAKDGSGDLVYEASGFSARIAPDGTVAFTEKRVPGLSVVPWLPSRSPLAVPSLQGTLANGMKGKGPPPAPPVDDRLPPPETTQLIPDVSRYRPDPREDCEKCQEPYTPAIATVFGRGDISDELERFSGKDPNRYQKAVFLAATHDRRIDMAVKAHARDVRRANVELPERLQFVACDDRLSYRERRTVLVALGREMDRATPDGARASAAIADFVKLYDAGTIACGNTP